MNPLPWHEPLWNRLRTQHAQGRLPQVILLAGPRGLGKEIFARQLAAHLLCESGGERACGECRGCVQLRAASHPDALLLSTDGLHCLAAPDAATQGGAIQLWAPDKDSKKRDIGVDGIRSLIERLGLSRHYGAARVAVISPADALNASGANMLLKTIEEPSPGTHLVLVSEQWRELPATLRSRCQIWRLAAPKEAQVLPWLRARHPDQDGATLAPYLRTPLLAARALEAGAAEQRAQWARALAAPAESPRFPALKREDARLGLECWLELASAWLRQRLAPTAGGPKVPANLDAAGLSALSRRIYAGMRGLDRNGNPALIMESIIIRTAGHAVKGEKWLDPAAHNPEF